MTVRMLAAVTALLGCLAGSGGVPVRAAGSAQNAESEAAKVQLREKLKEAGNVPEQEYSIASWAELRIAMEAARAIADKPAATPGELQAAYASVQRRMDAL